MLMQSLSRPCFESYIAYLPRGSSFRAPSPVVLRIRLSLYIQLLDPRRQFSIAAIETPLLWHRERCLSQTRHAAVQESTGLAGWLTAEGRRASSQTAALLVQRHRRLSLLLALLLTSRKAVENNRLENASRALLRLSCQNNVGIRIARQSASCYCRTGAVFPSSAARWIRTTLPTSSSAPAATAILPTSSAKPTGLSTAFQSPTAEPSGGPAAFQSTSPKPAGVSATFQPSPAASVLWKSS